MLVHTVIFWGKPSLTLEQRTAFRAGLETLRKVPSVGSVHIGSPAAVPDRPVVDKSYVFALTVIFNDVQAHNDYQVHPVHVAFVDNNKQYWERVQIFDSE